MGKLERINWVYYCILIFVISRVILIYEFDLARNLFVGKHANFFGSMCKWDCQWYISIVRDGYDTHVRSYPKAWFGLANWAFFPLYPMLVKLFTFAFAAGVVTTGIILNQLFIFFSSLVFYKYLRLYFDERNSRFGIILLLFSPFSIYFMSLYTEALFLFLSLLAFYCLSINKQLTAVIAGGLLSATRPVGVVFGVVFTLYQIYQRNITLRALIYCLLSVSGLLLYMLYLHKLTGDYLAFQHIQRGWGRVGFNSNRIWLQLYKMVTDYNNFIMFLISIVIAIFLAANKFYKEALFNVLCILPGALTGTMLSEARFCGTLFTFYLGLVVIAKKSNSLKIGLAVLFLVFYLSYFMYWLAKARFLV
jgi:Gpi18-like mannosyltransferase